MPSSRFLLAPIHPPASPFLPRPVSSPSVRNCLDAFDGVSCQPAQPTIVYISLAVVLLPILACILLIACCKIFFFCREPASPNREQQDLRHSGAARTAGGEVAMTNGQLDGVKLVILAGGDGPPVMAMPCVLQGHDGLPGDLGIWLEKQKYEQMGVDRKERQ